MKQSKIGKQMNLTTAIKRLLAVATKKPQALPILGMIKVQGNQATATSVLDLFYTVAIPGTVIPDGIYSRESFDLWLKANIVPTPTALPLSDFPRMTLDDTDYTSETSWTIQDGIEFADAYQAAAIPAHNTRRPFPSEIFQHVCWTEDGHMYGTDNCRLMVVYSDALKSKEPAILIPTTAKVPAIEKAIGWMNGTTEVKAFIKLWKYANEKSTFTKWLRMSWGTECILIHCGEGTYKDPRYVIPGMTEFSMMDHDGLTKLQEIAKTFKDDGITHDMYIVKNMSSNGVLVHLVKEDTREFFQLPMWQGKDITIAFDPEYLHDGLRLVNAQCMKYNDNLSPVVLSGTLQASSTVDAIYTLMPRKCNI